MKTRQEYEQYISENFTGKARELLLKNVELYYKENIDIKKNKYSFGDYVYLKKGTFIHGLGGSPDSYNSFHIFDYVCKHGFIGGDFNNRPTVKIYNSVGMWNIKKDIFLKDYIKLYSGVTIKYRKGDRERGLTDYYELVPHNQIEKRFIELNNDKDVWQWSAEQTKEVRFLPSLFSDKNQIAFILNMESNYAKEVAKQDVWNKELRQKKIMKYFCSEYFLPELLEGNFNASTTDREAAIMFGITQRLIEGVFIGKNIEKDKEKLKYIKSKLPDCYICNLDGKVIL
ncbi:MAG: hypothetical protein VZS44_03605 [Bacilli bacterium]|nr:hypothetical protein [Bacilli bacterium]